MSSLRLRPASREDADAVVGIVRSLDEAVLGSSDYTRADLGAGSLLVERMEDELRARGVGEALLHDAFGKFWRERRREVGLGVDAQSNTGANRLYERVGMHVHWGAVVFEKELS
jgi:GNAT superfamily N-acetyltransferase